ncbi:MAG: ABC transporter permease [Kiritimatiellae bacterium]|nr:ABC transporter permease [Kiritimatiellia bacterium]
MLNNRTPYKGHSWLVLSGLALFFCLWCLFSYSGAVNPILLPSPSRVANECLRLLCKGVLLRFTLASMGRVLIGWSTAVLLAVPIGIMIGVSRRAAALFQPAILFARYIPVVALLPLSMLYLGTDNTQKCFIIFLGSFFQLVLMVASSMQAVPRDYVRAGATMGMANKQIFRHILLPCAYPSILNDTRITIGWAWTYLVVAEMAGAHSGLGFMIFRAQNYLATDRIFLGLILIGFIGVLTDYLFKMLIDVLVPWKKNI